MNARRARSRFRPTLSGLEDRNLMTGITAGFSDGVLYILGTPADDYIAVRRVGDRLTVDQVPQVFSTSQVSLIAVSGQAGNDFISINSEALPGQDPITMALMMAPMYVLFEASILFSWLLDRRAGRAAAEEDVEESEAPEPELVTTDQD